MWLFFLWYCDHRDLHVLTHSFPTRRSSDLIDDALWNEVFDVNVLSGARLARHYAGGMRDRGWGRIQFISSESALNIPTEMVHYGVSKAAVQGLSRGLAKVLAGSGVTVNTILPGPTRTERSEEHTSELQSLIRNSYAVF